MVKRCNETFTFKLGETIIEKDCHFVVGRYQEPNNLALMVEDSNDCQVCVCSVNPRYKHSENTLCVKDWSENKGMVEFLVSQGIILNEYDWFESEESGFVVINAYKLTEKGLKLFEGI